MPDVNVLVGAFRADHPDHERSRRWLEEVLRAGETIGLSAAVMSSVVRLLTHRRLWVDPDSPDSALAQVEALRRHPQVVEVAPGPRNWAIFSALCRDADARGNLVSDAAHAALAIEHGAMWVSLDRDFARFPGLRWELPSSGGTE